jgi:hypothetical protein
MLSRGTSEGPGPQDLINNQHLILHSSDLKLIT